MSKSKPVAPKFEDGYAQTDQTGCTRPGCHTEIRKGEGVKFLGTAIYCESPKCTGLFTENAKKLGEAYMRAVTEGEPLPNVDDYRGTPRANRAVERTLANMTDEELLAYMAKRQGSKLADIADAPRQVTSRGKARK